MGGYQYKGIIDCYRCMMREEGVGALYRALPPRLMSVVPMMGIQLCVYEMARAQLLRRNRLLQEDEVLGGSHARQEVKRKNGEGAEGGTRGGLRGLFRTSSLELKP